MPAPSYLLALDQGTSSSRALVFRDDGSVHSMAQQEFPQIYPQPGWVEHDPEAIWNSQLATARQALAQGGLTPTDICGIGITNQRETTLLWNRKTGRPAAQRHRLARPAAPSPCASNCRSRVMKLW